MHKVDREGIYIIQTQNFYSGLSQPNLYPLSSNSNQDESSTNPRLKDFKLFIVGFPVPKDFPQAYCTHNIFLGSRND